MIYCYNKCKINYKTRSEIPKIMNTPDQNNINDIPDIKSVKDLGRKINTTDALLLSLIALVLCAFLPIALFYNMQELILEGASLVAIGASILALYKIVGSKRPFVPTVITAAIAFFFIGATTTALVISFMVSICLIAHVLLFADNTAAKAMCVISPVASYAIAVVVIGGFAVSTTALIPLVAALALYYAVSQNLHKVSAICHMSAGMLIFICAIVAIRYVALHGTDLAVAKEAIEAFREALTDLTAQMLMSVATELSEIAEISMTDATELATVSVNATFNLLPAIIIVIANVASFFTHSMMMATTFSEKEPSPTLKNMMLFEMSLISAIGFMAFAILGLAFVKSDVSVWLVTAENVVIILMPGMILTAIMMLRGLTATAKGCAPSLIYFGIIFSMLYIPAVMLPLVSVAGAVTVILNNIAKHKLLKK